MVWLHSSRWTSLAPTVSNQPTAHGNSHATCAVYDPRGPLHPTLQVQQEAHTQYAIGHSPGENHHGAAAATTASDATLFAMLRHCRPAKSALEPTRSALTTPPAMCCPCGTTQHPLTANMTSKDVCSIRVDKSFVGTSNDPADAQAKATTTSAWVVEMPTMEPRSAPPSVHYQHACQVGHQCLTTRMAGKTC
jgi:hypothetical protein